MPRLTASRRTFLAGSAAAVAVPYFAWQPRTLAAETRSPSDRIALGLIGAGSISQANLKDSPVNSTSATVSRLMSDS